MKVSTVIALILVSLITTHENESEENLRFLQMRCSPDCFFGQLCGDFCVCIWPNCIIKRNQHKEEIIDSHTAISRLNSIGQQDKEDINKRYSTHFSDIRNTSCCCGVLGISCGPCTPTLPGAQIGVGCCCSFK